MGRGRDETEELQLLSVCNMFPQPSIWSCIRLGQKVVFTKINSFSRLLKSRFHENIFVETKLFS